MSSIARNAIDLGWLDRLSRQDTALHRVDPRAKLIVTLVYVVVVLSYGRYQVAPLLPLAAVPVLAAAAGNVPARFILRKLLIASPFAILLGLFNPLFDRAIMFTVGSLPVSGGWVSYASILVRFVLTVSATLVLVATTGMFRLCRGLERLGVPTAFTVQLLMLYRYLFVLVEEASRVSRARAMRSAGRRGQGLRVYGSMLGGLLLRAMDRAGRVHTAMCCRGFDGHVRTVTPLRFGPADAAFVAVGLALLVLLRVFDVARLIGSVVAGG